MIPFKWFFRKSVSPCKNLISTATEHKDCSNSNYLFILSALPRVDLQPTSESFHSWPRINVNTINTTLIKKSNESHPPLSALQKRHTTTTAQSGSGFQLPEAIFQCPSPRSPTYILLSPQPLNSHLWCSLFTWDSWSNSKWHLQKSHGQQQSCTAPSYIFLCHSSVTAPAAQS